MTGPDGRPRPGEGRGAPANQGGSQGGALHPGDPEGAASGPARVRPDGRRGRPVQPEAGAPERDDLTAAGAPASFTDDDRWIDELEDLADSQARAMGIRPQVEFEVPGLRVTADIGGEEPGRTAYGAPQATRPAPGEGGPATPPGAARRPGTRHGGAPGPRR